MIIRILKFIGLKILELGGATLVIYLLSFYHDWVIPFIAKEESLEVQLNMSWIERGLLGTFLLIFPLAILFVIGVLLFFWIQKNWEWSE